MLKSLMAHLRNLEDKLEERNPHEELISLAPHEIGAQCVAPYPDEDAGQDVERDIKDDTPGQTAHHYGVIEAGECHERGVQQHGKGRSQRRVGQDCIACGVKKRVYQRDEDRAQDDAEEQCAPVDP